jgi:5'-3' exonuclease
VSILVDADFILYKNAASCETEIDFGDNLIVVQSRFSDLTYRLERELGVIANRLHVERSELILFFSDIHNFRKDIYPDYKGHRQRKKPNGYKRGLEWLRERYQLIIMPTLEADDALGIFSTEEPDEHTIVSPDKDMRQIPGHLYNLTDDPFYVTPGEAFRWHFIQALAGDTTDGYAGCPTYGVVKAQKLFDKEGYTWDVLVKAYESQGLTESDALVNARLARILTTDDYDHAAQRPILWTPPSK